MDEPNLYTVVARLQRNNEAFDEIYANVGVRSYTVTPDGGLLHQRRGHPAARCLPPSG